MAENEKRNHGKLYVERRQDISQPQAGSSLIMLEEGWETPCLMPGMTLDSALFFFFFKLLILYWV